MHGYPFFHSHADGGYFAVFHPDAHQTFPDAGGDAEPGAGFDQGIFQGGDVGVQIPAAAVQVRDGVAHKLAGPVVGGLSSPVDFMDGEGQHGAGMKAGIVARAADGVHAGVFQQQQFVFPFRVVLVGPHQFFLHTQGFLIVCQAGNADDVHVRAGRGCVPQRVLRACWPRAVRYWCTAAAREEAMNFW